MYFSAGDNLFWAQADNEKTRNRIVHFERN
jgi:hypothetical protein